MVKSTFFNFFPIFFLQSDRTVSRYLLALSRIVFAISAIRGKIAEKTANREFSEIGQYYRQTDRGFGFSAQKASRIHVQMCWNMTFTFFCCIVLLIVPIRTNSKIAIFTEVVMPSLAFVISSPTLFLCNACHNGKMRNFICGTKKEVWVNK